MVFLVCPNAACNAELQQAALSGPTTCPVCGTVFESSEALAVNPGEANSRDFRDFQRHQAIQINEAWRPVLRRLGWGNRIAFTFLVIGAVLLATLAALAMLAGLR